MIMVKINISEEGCDPINITVKDKSSETDNTNISNIDKTIVDRIKKFLNTQNKTIVKLQTATKDWKNAQPTVMKDVILKNIGLFHLDINDHTNSFMKDILNSSNEVFKLNLNFPFMTIKIDLPCKKLNEINLRSLHEELTKISPKAYLTMKNLGKCILIAGFHVANEDIKIH